MIQEGYKSQSLDSQIDLRYIFRTLKKNAVFILMCVCLTGMFSYVILDHSLKDTYTVSVNLCVIPRDNTSEKLAETNIENALERSVNVLNSDTMRDQIMKASGSSRVKGNLSASVVADTNIIRMSASGTNAESAYKLLKGALQQYPELSDYFESGYVLQPLSSISANNVQKTEKATLRYSLLLILLVLAGGIGATVCLCIFTDKIHSMEQAKRLLDIPMIGSLDYVKKKSGQKALLISDQDTDHVYEEAVDRIVTSIRSEMSAEGYKTLMVGSGSTKGVDADVADKVTDENLEETISKLKAFSKATGSIIAVTGAIDLVCNSEKCYVIRNGKPQMSSITGTGCQLSGLMTAYLVANSDNKLEAAAAAVCLMGLAGEIAYDRMQDGDGNSTYRNRIIDAIYNMDGETLEKGAKYEIK